MIRKIYLILPKNDLKKVVYLFLFIVIGMFFEVFGIGILLPVLSAILNPETLLQNPLFSSIFTFLKVTNTEELIRISLIALMIIYIVKGVFLLTTNYFQNKINSNLIASVSDRLFSKFIQYPYLKHTTENTSDYLKTIQVEVSNFYVFLMAGIYFITETSIIISIVIALLIIEPLGTTVMMIFFFLSSSLFYSVSKKLSARWGKIRETNDKNITKMLLESFGGVKELIITNSFSYFKNKYNQLLTVKADVSTKNLTLNQLPRYYLEVLIVLAFVMFIWGYLRSGYSVDNLLVTLGVFVGATLRMLPSINRVLSSLQQIKYYQSSVDIIYNELVEQVTVEENEVFSSAEPSLVLENKLQVNKVSFTYPNKPSPVINDISFSISKGTTIGIIGSSGSGKSTLINIIAGLLYPYEGSFLVDDTVVTSENRIAWRNTIGYVSQNTFLSDTSILQNIAYGTDPKDISVERVNQVIDESQLRTLVDTLEEGIHTHVGERGVQFSGGQQQRIGIARALYRNPSVLILDEATSALDEHTEALVMKSIDALKGKKTVIIVTHRLSTLKNCDAIYELKEGVLVNQKTTDFTYEK